MARLARIAIVNVPHHVTQRGNARQFLLAADSERFVYLELLWRHLKLYDLTLLGYCLMSNHVHLLVMPCRPDSLALALKNTQGATPRTGTLRTSPADTSGRGGSILVRSTTRTCGWLCATPNEILYARVW